MKVAVVIFIILLSIFLVLFINILIESDYFADDESAKSKRLIREYKYNSRLMRKALKKREMDIYEVYELRQHHLLTEITKLNPDSVKKLPK